VKYLVLVLLLIATPCYAPSAYALNLSQSCVAFYKLDEDAADKDVKDETGQNSGVSVRNTNLYHSVGKVLGALDFNGTTDVVDCQSDFVFTKPITFCAWIFPQGWGEDAKGTVATNARFNVRIVDTNETVGISSNISLGGAGSANNAIVLNTWTFVAGTRTTTGIANIYVNGKLSGNPDQDSETPVNGVTNLFIGAGSAATRAFDGLIDNLMIFDRVLTPIEITKLYNAGRGLNSLSTLDMEITHGIKS